MRELDPNAGYPAGSLPDASPARDEECYDVPAAGGECPRDASHVEVGQLRTNAAKTMMDLAIQSGKYFDRLVGRQRSAWSTLFAKAGRSPYVALSEGEYGGMVYSSTSVSEGSAFTAAGGTVAGAIGNTALEGIAGRVGEKTVGDIGVRAILKGQEGKGIAALSVLLKAFRGAGVPGFVFSTVVNVVWDIISGLISPDPDVGEIVDSGIADSQNARTAVEKSITAASEAKKDHSLNSIKMAHDFVLGCNDHDALRAVLEWAIQNLSALSVLPAEEDAALGHALLKQWVLQHSATPSDANEDTTDQTFSRVRDSIDVNLKGRSDLFVYQCKYAWGRMGVDVGRMSVIFQMALAAHKGKNPADIADALEGLELSLDPIQDGQRFAQYLASEHSLYGVLGPRDTIPEDPERAVKNRTFNLTCTLSLKEADGAVCLDELVFDLIPHAGYNAWQLDSRSYNDPDAPELSAIASRRWDYSPK